MEPVAALSDAESPRDDVVACRASAAASVHVAAGASVTAVAVMTEIVMATPAADAATLSDVASPDWTSACALSTPPPEATKTAPAWHRPGHAFPATTTTSTRPATTAIPSVPPPRLRVPHRRLRPKCAPPPRPVPPPAVPAPWRSSTSRARPDMERRRSRRPKLVYIRTGSPRRLPPAATAFSRAASPRPPPCPPPLGSSTAIVAYLLNIRILGPVAPLTGQYSRGGLN